MISYKVWKEAVAPVANNVNVNNEVPTNQDYDFYHTKLSGNIKRYLGWLVGELEKTEGKLSLVRKGFIIQEVMDALNLNPNQVSRLSNNIKRGFLAWQAAQRKLAAQQKTPPGTPTPI